MRDIGGHATSGASYPPIIATVSVAANAAASLTDQVTAGGGGAYTATGSDVTTVLGAAADVLPTDFFYDAVNLLREYGITAGCGTNPIRYCPNDNVTRAQMAIFVMRGAFNLLLPANTPIIAAISPTSVNQNQTTLVTVTGLGTSFVQGTTQVNAGPSVTAGTITVSSPTSLTVQRTPSASAVIGPRTLRVITGSVEPVLPNGLTIAPQ